jgi:hypothetical protein
LLLQWLLMWLSLLAAQDSVAVVDCKDEEEEEEEEEEGEGDGEGEEAAAAEVAGTVVVTIG